jgi:hypothetical protein
MKNFVRENWYKLMIGSSFMMASFGFMIFMISPVYSNSENGKPEIKNLGILKSPIGINSWVDGNHVYFVDGGYIYRFKNSVEWGSPHDFFRNPTIKPEKVKLQ